MDESASTSGFRQRRLFDESTVTTSSPVPPVTRKLRDASPKSRPVLTFPESQAVHDEVSATFYRLAAGTGMVAERDLLEILQTERRVAVTSGSLVAILDHLAQFLRLPNGHVVSIDQRSKSPLTRYLRQILSVMPGGVPFDVARIQLARRNRRYLSLSNEDFSVIATAHPDLSPIVDRLRPNPGKVCRPDLELGGDEHRIFLAIQAARRPLIPEDIPSYVKHCAHISPVALKIALRESVVLAPMDGGSWDVLRPSTELFRSIRERASRDTESGST